MRVSEIYLSVQGEGPRVGRPTVFLRFGGCNLRCAGWPCDTQHAIDPKFRKEWKKMGIEEVVQAVRLAGEGIGAYNVCYTGGEPFLQNNEELMHLTERLRELREIGTIECFSNGALAYPPWAWEWIYFVLDWKLPGSGELTNSINRIENVKQMEDLDHAIKFTIKNKNDYETAKEVAAKYELEEHFDVYYGVVWNEITNSQLIDWVLADRLPWIFTMQVHNHVWDRRKRGI